VANSNGSLNQAVAQVTSQFGSSNADAASQISAVTQQLQQLQTVSQVQADAVEQNTDAVLNNTATRTTSSGGTSTADTVASIASSVLGSGLGLIPLISGLVGLFSGGSSSPPPLVAYQAPDSISLEGDVSRSTNTINWAASHGTQSKTPAATSGPQVTVQVNAMDSQSFLDHSQEIAKAVRSAMLNSSSLNDVVNEL
jgi:hypothetical protein